MWKFLKRKKSDPQPPPGHWSERVCSQACADPTCQQVGCLEQPAWKFADDIRVGREYKQRRKIINPVK